MLRKVDMYGYVNIENTAFYLHWSLAGERVEIITRNETLVAQTVVGQFKLMHPHSEYIEKKRPLSIQVRNKMKRKIMEIRRIAASSGTFNQVCN